jgi:menaquinone-dependent protoporphyrinogen oxidase
MAPRILMGFSTSEGQTAKVAEQVARTLRAAGCEVDVHDVGEISHRSLADYDGVVLGASIHMGRHQPRMEKFVRNHRDELAGKPNAFFSVSMTASNSDEKHQRQAEDCVHVFEQQTGWKPAMFALFAGALAYTHYGFILRFVIKRIAKKEGGPTDTSRDYELTNWESVAHFAEDFLRMLGMPSTNEQPAPALLPRSPDAFPSDAPA